MIDFTDRPIRDTTRNAGLGVQRIAARKWLDEHRTLVYRGREPARDAVVREPHAHLLRGRGCAIALSGPRVRPGLLRRDRLDRYRWNRPPGLRRYLAEVENWAKSLYVRTSDDGVTSAKSPR